MTYIVADAAWSCLEEAVLHSPLGATPRPSSTVPIAVFTRACRPLLSSAIARSIPAGQGAPRSQPPDPFDEVVLRRQARMAHPTSRWSAQIRPSGKTTPFKMVASSWRVNVTASGACALTSTLRMRRSAGFIAEAHLSMPNNEAARRAVQLTGHSW